MCQRNTVVAKNFSFTFSSIGHGGYLVSSNGGSWSSHQAIYNNAVKSFKFIKGDIVWCEYDPVQ